MSAEVLAEMMSKWNQTEARARKMFPQATEEEIYSIVAAAMNKSLGL